ncbi:KinB-signaling pathway activation protein [Salirhabdus sp. Marseille-P4669]|uniref:KinB-signaling pathway activation protein n=1 Tax=Salirhabdus sp. Marseille-P4669 TaxID=2042310 RepID=UPI000C7B55BE|nr:KinB-signaling pathway activation protein [Salirhabdus sp. Marseille-P4669]
MTSRNWVRLFTRTLLLGAIVAILMSFFVKSSSYSANLSPFDTWEIFGLLIWFAGIGFLFSIVSQTGFFAYLVLNQIGLGVFKGYWPTVQIGLIAFALFDLVYFPFKAAGEGASIFPYLITAFVIFAFGYVVSYIKARETNKRAFVPALFFMVVITIIEWVPVLRTGDADWMLLMIAPLLACNTYQLLVLHKINKKVEEEKQQQDTKTQNHKSKK